MDNALFKNGATWCKADFHLHTKSDKEFKYDGKNFESDYIENLEKANIKIGIITNHNKFNYDEFKELKKKAKAKNIFLLYLHMSKKTKGFGTNLVGLELKN